MSQDPMPQPGWYPQPDGQDRWWNGASWSDSFRPAQAAAPVDPDPGQAGQAAYGQPGQQTPGQQGPGQVPYGQPFYASGVNYQQAGYQQPGYQQAGYAQPGQGYYAPPQGSSHTVRNVLLGVGLVLVLLIGGCAAVVAVAVNRVDDTVNDQTPGGPNVPLAITEGEAFSVENFDYSAGWSIGTDEFESLTVKDLEVTNNRDGDESAFVYVDLRAGGSRVARIDCYSDSGQIDPGDSVTLTCFSSDQVPATYDQITIRDQY